MAPVELPDAMAPEPPIWKQDRGLVGNSKIGERGVELDVCASTAKEEAKVADISLGRHCLGWGGSAAAVIG